MATRTFSVEEIHCAACETAIRKALTRLDGVRTVSPDAATNQVTVDFDDTKVNDDAVTERLAVAGYPVVS